jgi:hypothetical protein
MACQTGLAMAYQQAATIANAGLHLVRARECMNHALDLHLQELLPQQQHEPAAAALTKTVIGNLYIMLSDNNLQLGDYENAKRMYQHSMEWHRDQHVPVTPLSDAYDDEFLAQFDELIKLYRQQLDEYHRYVKAGKAGGAYNPNDPYNMYYMEQDDGYEGELLSAMGGMYLAKGEIDRGVELLKQAVDLLDSAGSDKKKNRRAMADAQINLAAAYFRQRQFDESQKLQFAALDTYRGLYGNGVNPYTQAFEDVEGLFAESGLGDVYQQLKNMIDSNTDQTDNPRVTIDIEKYKSSLLNATLEEEEEMPKETNKRDSNNNDKDDL